MTRVAVDGRRQPAAGYRQGDDRVAGRHPRGARGARARARCAPGARGRSRRHVAARGPRGSAGVRPARRGARGRARARVGPGAEVDAVVVLACDMPFVEPPLLELLADVARHRHRHPDASTSARSTCARDTERPGCAPRKRPGTTRSRRSPRSTVSSSPKPRGRRSRPRTRSTTSTPPQTGHVPSGNESVRPFRRAGSPACDRSAGARGRCGLGAHRDPTSSSPRNRSSSACTGPARARAVRGHDAHAGQRLRARGGVLPHRRARRHGPTTSTRSRTASATRASSSSTS